MTCEPYMEPLDDMPETDVALEGGYWQNKERFIVTFIEKSRKTYPDFDRNTPIAVVRFRFIPPEDMPPEPTQRRLEFGKESD